MAEIPRTHFVQSGDADLAYQVFGAGEDMVAIPGLPSHLGVMWELPECAAFLDRLASHRRFIAALEQGRAQVVAEVQRLDRSEVVLAGGRRLRPDAVTCATGYRRGLEPLVGHLADRPAFPGRGIGYRQHWN